MHTNYIISLPTAIQRREHIKQEFGKQDIPFEFYNALMPSEQLNQLIQKYLPNLSQASLSEGEKACFMSHYILWQKCIDENLPYIFIFEDDIYLGENAKELLEIDYIPKDTDILKLETLYGKIMLGSMYKIKCQRNIFQLKYKHTGMGGYTITAKGARYLLNKIQNRQLVLAIDTLIFDKLLDQREYKVMQLYPAVCIQDLIINGESKFKSSLQDGRETVHANQPKTTPLEKVINELGRIKRRIFGKPVSFK